MGSSKAQSSRSRLRTVIAALAALAVLAVGTATAQAANPIAETTGSPVRTATTAILQGRVDSGGASTTYHFDYGTSPLYGQTTPDVAIGVTDGSVPVAARIDGLTPGTTYHYRIIADNGTVVAGDDFTVTTRASDSPLSHGRFSGPAGSDRAWEMISRRDIGDNPVIGTLGIAHDGNSLVYTINGGAPGTSTGSVNVPLAAKRGADGWVEQSLLPPRAQLAGQQWSLPAGADDLSSLLFKNYDLTGDVQYWRISPGGDQQLLHQSPLTDTAQAGFYTMSEDGSRASFTTFEEIDPGHPNSPGGKSSYLLDGATPRMWTLLPDGSTGCVSAPAGGDETVIAAMHWLSADGNFGYFVGGPSCSPAFPQHLYGRNLDAESTVLLDPAPISGEHCGTPFFLKSTSSWVYFGTSDRLTPDDSVGCGNGDVYRVHPDGTGIECTTCANGPAAIEFPGTDATQKASSISIADDDSRLYFLSFNKLTPDAPSDGGIYRVDLESKQIALASPSNDNAPSSHAIGFGPFPGAISPNGRVLIFQSFLPKLNTAVSDNGGNFQWYRYDDADRSLTCISCRPDGSATPTGTDVIQTLAFETQAQEGPNLEPVADDGTFLFATSEPLVAADQNTAAPSQDPAVGRDIYEWRDGRPILVSDGVHGPAELFVAGISPDATDAYFIESRALTPDAPDNLPRLYDARIGGGFDFAGTGPAACSSVDECRDTPAPVPTDPAPGSSSYSGPGNHVKHHRAPKQKCKAKKKHRKCKAKKRSHK